MVVVVKSKVCVGVSNTTASHLYMKYNGASLRNLEAWRDKLFTKTRGGSGVGSKTSKAKEDGREEKGEKEIENHISTIEESFMKSSNLYLDVNKVINTLSVHLEKIQSADKKEKMIDKKKGDIVYTTKDGRVLHAFHSCSQGKILWDDNVYESLNAWLAAASIIAPSRRD
jgi:hypothetical protein